MDTTSCVTLALLYTMFRDSVGNSGETCTCLMTQVGCGAETLRGLGALLELVVVCSIG